MQVSGAPPVRPITACMCHAIVLDTAVMRRVCTSHREHALKLKLLDFVNREVVVLGVSGVGAGPSAECITVIVLTAVPTWVSVSENTATDLSACVHCVPDRSCDQRTVCTSCTRACNALTSSQQHRI